MAQGDQILEKKYIFSKENKNFTWIDILGTGFLKNYHFQLPFSIDILDARHFYSQSDLASLGRSLRISKVEGIHFQEKKASQWLQENEELFLKYAVIDSILPREKPFSTCINGKRN